MALSNLTLFLLCSIVSLASCQLEENFEVNPNDVYRPQIWSLLKYLNSNSERIYNYNRADFVDAQKKDNEVTDLTIDVEVECIRKEPEVPCATNVLTCQGSVQYLTETNSYETLSGVSCSPKVSIQIPSADETEELPTTEYLNTHSPVELSHEVASSESGEQFVAVRSHSKHCLGCPIDLNLDAEGSSVLIGTALKHVETERTHKQALVNVLRIQQQIVAGVKYILLIEIAPTVCTKEVQATDLQSCPIDFAYPTEICEVVYLERPWINKNKYIIGNNCTVTQQFASPEQKLNESNGNDLDNEIDVNGDYKKPSFPIEDIVRTKGEAGPNFDKIAESGQMEDAISPARLAELESQILFQEPVKTPKSESVPMSSPVTTQESTVDPIVTNPLLLEAPTTHKSALTDEQKTILDEFFLSNDPQPNNDNKSSEEDDAKKTVKKDNSSEKVNDNSSSEEEEPRPKRAARLEKVAIDEKRFIQELADFAVTTMDDIDSDNRKRVVLQIYDAKKINLDGAVYYLKLRVGVSKCLENPDVQQQEGCEKDLIDDLTKVCKIQVHVADGAEPKVIKSQCQNIKKDDRDKNRTNKRSKRGLLGGPQEISLDSPVLHNLLQNSVSHLDYQSAQDNRYKILEVLSASYQIVSGKLYTIKVKIAPTNCFKHDPDETQDCGFLQDGDVKICNIRIWDQPWLANGRQTNITCEGDDKVHSFRSKRSLHYHKYDYTVRSLFDDFIRIYNKAYEGKLEYKKRLRIFQNNMKLVRELNDHELGTARYGVTKFADLTREEFSSYLGLRPDLRNENDIPFARAKIPDIELPVEFDWRSKDAVSEVKDQGQCGSCWAFSVTGNLEGQYAIKHGQLMEFSEQELVDCDHVDEGCNGGLMDNAYRVIEKLGGLETEQDYPYDAEDEKCHFNKTLARVQVSGALNISHNETDMAKWLVANGPISIAINANAMQFYMGGVSHPWKSLCSSDNLDHGVLIVGYGVHKYPLFKKQLPYWIVKNSWGKSWGEQGYYRVYRGDGTCGLNQTPSSAIVE